MSVAEAELIAWDSLEFSDSTPRFAVSASFFILSKLPWDPENEKWYFSIVDVVGALTDAANARRYWSDLKRKLKNEGAIEVYEKIVQLKLLSPDGKHRLTDVAGTEQLLRIIQSIPSPKAEPFKMWLAMVGRERIEEDIDPELTIDRALEAYAKKGYDKSSPLFF